MELKRLSVRAEFKASDAGVIEGYGSVFDVLDYGDDIVAKGAFTRTLSEAKATGALPAMLWQHDTTAPIGVWTEMSEDDRGLYVKGQILDTSLGRDARVLAKGGAVTGLSIGYWPQAFSVDHKSGVRTLQDVDLIETSLVTFPMNPAARITSAKSADAIQTIREFEEFLRDAGFSKSQSVRIAADGFKALDRRDSGGEAKDVAARLAAISAILTR